MLIFQCVLDMCVPKHCEAVEINMQGKKSKYDLVIDQQKQIRDENLTSEACQHPLKSIHCTGCSFCLIVFSHGQARFSQVPHLKSQLETFYGYTIVNEAFVELAITSGGVPCLRYPWPSKKHTPTCYSSCLNQPRAEVIISESRNAYDRHDIIFAKQKSQPLSSQVVSFRRRYSSAVPPLDMPPLQSPTRWKEPICIN